MSVFTKLVTFIKTTLLSIRAFLLPTFRTPSSPSRISLSTGTGPGELRCRCWPQAADILFTAGSLVEGHANVSKIVSSKAVPTSQPGGNIAKSSISAKDSLPATLPLLVVTNLVRTSAITPQKQVQSQRRGDNVHPARPKSVPAVRNGVSPLTPRLKLESASLNFATGMQSVFYTAHNDEEDCHDAEYHNVRHLFNRDSVWPGLTSLDHIDAADEEDEEDGYGQPLSIRSSCYSPSSESSSEIFCVVAHALPNSQSSELPYLCDSVSSLSVTSSTSSESFNDLLASVERKWPGTEWSDNVQFSADEQRRRQREQGRGVERCVWA
ncbi:hypothetical protein B0H19DRAFT_1295264 [Mycena capillaripes]|nr:hypothetical protein B0H19DRAFT_1295264 [Mycena capillaripes]